MIGAKAILFIAVSMVNFCSIDQPTPDLIQFSQGHYGEGSLHWTYFDGKEGNAVIALELLNILHGYPQQHGYHGVGNWNKETTETLRLPGGEKWTVPKAELDLRRGTSSSSSLKRRVKRTSKHPKPCLPHEEPRTIYKTAASFPLRSAVWIVVLVENLAGLMLTWHAGRRLCHDEPGNKGKKKRRVAMLEGQVVESLPRGKLRDDSCVIVNLSPSNSSVSIIDEEDSDDDSFHML